MYKKDTQIYLTQLILNLNPLILDSFTNYIPSSAKTMYPLYDFYYLV